MYGLSEQEIGEILECSRQTASNLMNKLREPLREKYVSKLFGYLSQQKGYGETAEDIIYSLEDLNDSVEKEYHDGKKRNIINEFKDTLGGIDMAETNELNKKIQQVAFDNIKNAEERLLEKDGEISKAKENEQNLKLKILDLENQLKYKDNLFGVYKEQLQNQYGNLKDEFSKLKSELDTFKREIVNTIDESVDAALDPAIELMKNPPKQGLSGLTTILESNPALVSGLGMVLANLGQVVIQRLTPLQQQPSPYEIPGIQPNSYAEPSPQNFNYTPATPRTSPPEPD
jgi:chromosome segregation ATPase